MGKAAADRAKPRTAADADTYFEAYAAAIAAIGASAGNAPLPQRPGIPVKPSAPTPRSEAIALPLALAALTPPLLASPRRANPPTFPYTSRAGAAAPLAPRPRQPT